MSIERFFETARERYQIRLRREAGMSREDWTQDPIFRTYAFCNVHREHDRTTIWFRNNIRQPLQDDRKVLMATIIFRWFNTIQIGEVLKPLLLSGFWSEPVWTEAHERQLKLLLKDVRPIVTGAFMVRSPHGISKIDGLTWAIEQTHDRLKAYGWFDDEADYALTVTLQETWSILRQFPYLGGFTAYEIVSDLRWTDMLCDAPDILTWANTGPGATRGLARVLDLPLKTWNYASLKDQAEIVRHMQELLKLSKYEEFWPQEFKPWEMREVEHWLCEYDKYMRVAEGGTLKRLFRPNVS